MEISQKSKDRIIQEEKYLQKALKQIAEIESRPKRHQHRNVLELRKATVEFEQKEILLLKSGYFDIDIRNRPSIKNYINYIKEN